MKFSSAHYGDLVSIFYSIGELARIVANWRESSRNVVPIIPQ